MAKTVIDFKDYEGDKYETYTGDEPRPGWYTFELQTVGWYGEDKDTLRWIAVVADGPFAGWPGMVFGNMDSTKWKNQEIARAIQGGIEKPLAVDFDKPAEVAALVKRAKRIRGKVALNTNPATNETRLSLRKVAPLLEDTSTIRKGAPADDLDDQIEDVATDATDEVDGDYTEEELGDMTLADLKAILKDEFEFTARQLRTVKDEDAAIDAILNAQEEEAGDDPEAEGDGDTDTAEGEFDDDFAEGDPEPEPEPEPEPAPRRRRAAAAPAKAAPAKAAAPAQRTTRRRRA